jgi:(4S)-4-hydroxy-5-phosphonooxypentane-2,3-dione isomerase
MPPEQQVGAALGPPPGAALVSFVRAGRARLRYRVGMPGLLVVHVHVRVKPGAVEEFRRATLENAAASLREPGVARFDVVQDQEDPARFVLVEAYRDAAAPAAHKETAHYQAWRDAVAPLMAEPRTSRRFTAVFPEDARW